MAIETIYLDMDGVLCSFEKRYIELFGETPGTSRDRKEFSSNWTQFIEGKNFASLDWQEGAHKLLQFVETIPNVNIEILSSSGGQKYHAEVTMQKTMWLCERGISYKVNTVPGRALKSAYANASTILIDDTEDVVSGFYKAGGISILHKDVDETIRKLNYYCPNV
jgi:hypothetical protein